ncbi:unnamed protein product [Miscanthus lutarioriparius]|uniref:Retrotransposon gag domain-containing protein n=1 Tax=Miscanthus lutarioriparius TaxID=422564 RepID=A0A811QK41_9POAL|nr:unnamed protein product [Miscanthus lutarioriparius]
MPKSGVHRKGFTDRHSVGIGKSSYVCKRQWQEAKKRHNGDNDGSNPTIPWAWFEREFNDQYLDVMSREALRQQFVSLKQGSGTVQDYNMKCDNLMRQVGDRITTISTLQAQHLIESGCTAYLVLAMQMKSEVKNLSSILVVSEFTDVFHETLPRLPPEREVDLCIETK